MNAEQFIAIAYAVFDGFKKPVHVTDWRHCEECAEYDGELAPVTRYDLTIDQIGTACWGPLAFLTPEATAYFMPRLIEFAVLGVDDKDRSPFYEYFISNISSGPSDPRFSLFGPEHIGCVNQALEFIGARFGATLAADCWNSTFAQAADAWNEYRE